MANLLIVFFILLVSCVVQAQPTLVMQISVDHEGDTLDEEDLHAMEQFREAFPEVPLIQFLNPAYYTKEWAGRRVSRAHITRQISRVLRPQDELGLHIHGWERLINAVEGVTYRSTPSFWGEESVSRNGEAGDDIPFAVYSYEEARRVLRYSKQILSQHGFSPLTSFRAGGWASAFHTRRALVDEGFLVDGSPVPAQLVRKLYPDTNLERLSDKLWPNIHLTSQPYLEQQGLRQIWMFPDNGGLADYLTGEEFLEIVEQNIESAKDHSEAVTVVHYGFHLETAKEYVGRVAQAIRLARAYANTEGIDLVIGTYQDIIQSDLLNRPSRLRVEGKSCPNILE